MRLFIFFAILTIAYAGGDIFAIRDLIPMLTNWTDRAQLEVLMRDQTTPRSQIQAQVQEIVARQSEDVQVNSVNKFSTNTDKDRNVCLFAAPFQKHK